MSASEFELGEHAALRAALERDAQRVPTLMFNEALHAAIMQRVRFAHSRQRMQVTIASKLVCGTAFVAVVLAATFFLRSPEQHQLIAPLEAHRASTVIEPASRGSVLAYQEAAAQGDEVLIAMLDHDGLTLLPPSPSQSSYFPPSLD